MSLAKQFSSALTRVRSLDVKDPPLVSTTGESSNVYVLHDPDTNCETITKRASSLFPFLTSKGNLITSVGMEAGTVLETGSPEQGFLSMIIACAKNTNYAPASLWIIGVKSCFY